MTFVSVVHIILTPTQPVGSQRPQRESNPGPPHQKPRPLLIDGGKSIEVYLIYVDESVEISLIYRTESVEVSLIYRGE